MYKIIGADGKEYGPVSAEVVRQWITEGRANGLSKVLPENTTEWKSLKDVPEFAEVLGASATAATPLPFTPAPAPQKNNPLAVAGLVLGILSVTIGLCCCGIGFSIGGIVCSAIALSQLGKNPQQTGRGMAIAGLILSIAGLLIGIIIAVVYGFVSSMPDMMRRIQNL